ncbi:prepilin-type N-terminal cleavage/methylation domain-containing protein [Fervidibacter sp.]|jgi:prepilin-type N-terminal cleavage/methylation domain-containing protein
MRAKRFGLVWLRRKKGFSIIEVITAVAILGIGIWAIVALFPTGQNIIRRSGLRQMATQLAHEAISDFLADPAKMPFAIVPFNPADPQIANRPVLLEPADLLTVRYTYNFVWGEILDDGLQQGDPNKRIGLTLVLLDTNNDGQPDTNEWRTILRFAPASPHPNWDTNGDGQPEIRVYREVKYQPTTRDRNGDGFVNGLDVAEFEFFFDPQSSPVDVYLNVGSGIRPNGLRVLRVSYELAQQVGPIAQIWREVYIVPEGRNQFQLNQPALRILQIVEEFPLVPDNDPQQFPAANDLDNEFIAVGSSLHFASPTPPLKFITRVLGIPLTQDRLGPLRADYLIEDLDGDGRFAEDPIDGQDNDGDGRIDEDAGGHWIVETGTTFAPDPALRQKLNLPAGVDIGIFQTTFGGLALSHIQAVSLEPNDWGNQLTVSPISDLSSGLLVLEPQPNQPLPTNRRVRVAYLNQDDWFEQVVALPNDFQPVPPSNQNTNAVLQLFPYEQIRWFAVDLNQGALRFSPLLAGQSLEIRWTAANGQKFDAVVSLDGSGSLALPPNIARLDAVQRASVLIRLSGHSLWQQAPPRRKGDFVELITIVPPSQPVMP